MKKQVHCLKIRTILFLALITISVSKLQASPIANAYGSKRIMERTSNIVFADSTNAPEINTLAEHVFSGVRGTTSPIRNIIISNTGAVSLQVSSITISGTNASVFSLVNPQAAPFNIPPGSSSTVGLLFKPSGTQLGALNATLNINNNDPDEGALKVGLYGLSTKGEQGNNEPTFDAIVKTLGYNINVGGTGLLLPTTPAAIGDEVLTPLFKKAGSGNVTMKPVARYSPDDILDFGYYTKPNGAPVVKKIGQVALDQEQTLNPIIVAGSSTSFDPGNAVFGFYTGATSYANQPTFTEDAFNTGPLAHSARIYPLKNRAGQLIPNSYLVAFEPAKNGDYQDYVFAVSNVSPANSFQNQLLEAEKAEIFRALIKTGNNGFSGTGYVDYVNNTLDYIQWTLTSTNGGATSIQFRFASGSANRALRLIVNGLTIVPSLNFPATGGWAKWSTVNTTVTLQPGTNKIKLEANGSSVPNIDYLLVNPSSSLRINSREIALDPSSSMLEAALSPNPCFGETQVKIKTSSALTITIEVNDLLGKVYQIHKTKEHEFLLKGLNKGLYIIKVKQGEKAGATRLVVY